MGQEKEEKFMSYQLSDDHWLRRRRPGPVSSAEQQRLEVHRSFRRHAAFVEEHRRRMGLESRVASRRDDVESSRSVKFNESLLEGLSTVGLLRIYDNMESMRARIRMDV